jgi:hypothetical protein
MTWSANHSPNINNNSSSSSTNKRPHAEVQAAGSSAAAGGKRVRMVDRVPPSNGNADLEGVKSDLANLRRYMEDEFRGLKVTAHLCCFVISHSISVVGFVVGAARVF